MSNQTEQNYNTQPAEEQANQQVAYAGAGAPYQPSGAYEDDHDDTYRSSRRRGKNQNNNEGGKQQSEEPLKMVLRIVISILIIALGIFIILWAVAKASLFTSIGEMLRRMGTDLQVMFARITS